MQRKAELLIAILCIYSELNRIASHHYVYQKLKNNKAIFGQVASTVTHNQCWMK
jgi:hypothetical protein